MFTSILLNAAYEQLLIKGMKIARRTLTAAKAGTLSRGEYNTFLHQWVGFGKALATKN
ncbi:hypothetical protein [Aphanothece hegewaldii]|uniref:hypothetical protein n=1 Tax=Aphanothece hegewaldii TaxID=1521625 RepID=UPI0015E66FB7|nr:hypothetical protein [Aphanothece hegewaldii]